MITHHTIYYKIVLHYDIVRIYYDLFAVSLLLIYDIVRLSPRPSPTPRLPTSRALLKALLNALAGYRPD